MHKLLIRSASGIIYAALIIGAVAGGFHWFEAILSLFTVLAVIEFENIIDSNRPSGWASWAIRVLDVIAALSVVNLPAIFSLPSWITMTMLVIIGFYTLARFTFALYDRSAEAFRSAAGSVLAMAYIALPLTLLLTVYSDRPGMPALIMAMFIMIWLNDTGAFCVGSACRRHKLFERLSPKKSWEGFFGGLACDILAGVACFYILPEIGWTLPAWIAFGIMVCILATWGDLFESLMKRTMGIKDSGKLIPGHGGILDRIDSLLFVAVGTFMFCAIIDSL